MKHIPSSKLCILCFMFHVLGFMNPDISLAKRIDSPNIPARVGVLR